MTKATKSDEIGMKKQLNGYLIALIVKINKTYKSRYQPQKFRIMASFRVGESVKMKKGTMDAEYEKWDLSGWQGWVVATPKRGQRDTYQILWDTNTFKNMPEDFIAQANEDFDEWDVYYTVAEELETAFAKDTMKDAEKVAKEWRAKYPREEED